MIEKLNMKFGDIEDAYVIRNCDLNTTDAAASAICAITAGNYTEDYESAIDVVADFCKAANDETGYNVSVWLDA